MQCFTLNMYPPGIPFNDPFPTFKGDLVNIMFSTLFLAHLYASFPINITLHNSLIEYTYLQKNVYTNISWFFILQIMWRLK